jgi:ABC-type multidrug transport system ATPase subunit
MTIEIKNLSKVYRGGVEALKGVELTIGKGMFGLLGPNGAGKTTMMKILATLLEPTEGDVSIDGLDIRKDRERIRKVLSYLPQEFGVYKKIRVVEFIDYMASLGGILNRRKRRERVDEVLRQGGLADYKRRKVGTLSGGMLRRLGIAHALVTRPSVLIIDEPTVGLDPEERIKFRGLLQEIGRDRIIILSTHIIGDISQTCENLALLDRGRIIYKGSARDLIEKARGKTWEATVGEAEFEKIRRDYGIISTTSADGMLSLRLVGDRTGTFSLTPVEPTLEDAYIYFMETRASCKAF